MKSRQPAEVGYLDQVQFKKIFALDEASSKMKFFIEGMKCAKCVHRIESLQDQVEGAKSIQVDLGRGIATVEIWPEKGSFSEIVERVEKFGFKIIPVPSQEDGADLWKKKSQEDLLRLGIAGFLASNIMMLALATYFGDMGSLKDVFLWLQFALYLPVVTYVAFPFYHGFYQGLLQKNLTIDGPMAVASFSGFLISTWNLIQGRDTIYFDSLSGFLFLILLTRYWQTRTRYKYLQFLRPSALVETLKARLIKDGQLQWVPTETLRKSQRIIVQKSEWVPVDGILQSASARMDLSVLSGESYPQMFHQGALVQAGSKLLTDLAEIEVERVGQKTVLGQILSGLETQSMRDLESIQISDKASQYLLAIVFSIAGGLLAFGVAQNQFLIYFERAFALIILACPCAMAFGTPLVFSFAMKAASSAGVVVKSISFFEKILKVQKVFLDKTGTLTSSDWEFEEVDVLEVSPAQKKYFQSIILSLEARSVHPIAVALRKIWSDVTPTLVFQEVLEIPGVGVQGYFDQKHWALKTEQQNGRKVFGLYCDGVRVWVFSLESGVQKNVAEVISWFESKGLAPTLISGDSVEETRKFSEKIALQRYQGELKAQEKQEILRSNPFSMMIGDGYNDSLALQAAFVGIAAHGGVDASLKTADAFFIEPGLERLKKLFEIAAKARRQVRWNLGFALFYNLIGGVLAIFGFVNPFVAAVLMPISSSLILLATWRGMK